MFQFCSDSATERWILSRLSNVVEICNKGFAEYRLMDATKALHNFWWFEMCDVYLVSWILQLLFSLNTKNSHKMSAFLLWPSGSIDIVNFTALVFLLLHFTCVADFLWSCDKLLKVSFTNVFAYNFWPAKCLNEKLQLKPILGVFDFKHF